MFYLLSILVKIPINMIIIMNIAVENTKINAIIYE